MLAIRSVRSAPRTLRSAAVLALSAALLAAAPAAAQDRVSRFGEYSGYSEPLYDAWQRSSVYVPMPDGVELAVDLYLPTAGGVVAAEPLPVVLHYTRYLRAVEVDGETFTAVDQGDVLQYLLSHGYAVAVADARGTGASFGTRDGDFSAAEAADSYELIEWLADQEWCNGKVGMHGRSYPGTTQYKAATEVPPHLAAIFAEMASPILYDFVYQGGTYKADFIRQWSRLTEAMDRGRYFPPTPVDADVDGTDRDAAVAAHSKNLWARKLAPKAKYRDSVVRGWGWETTSAIYGADAIEASGVAVYHLAGWYDIFTTQQILLYANLGNAPQKMMIGPWTHAGGEGGAVHRAEMLRWFDFWLKGIDNGVMDEPPVHYYVMEGDNTVPSEPGRDHTLDDEGAEDPDRWRSSPAWPPRGAKHRKYYLGAGPSGSVASLNDGTLGTKRPKSAAGLDEATVDYTAVSSSFSRWMVGYGEERPDPADTTFFDERTAEDEKALTYTSEPLRKDLVVAGSPVVHLWVSSTHDDGDFFVYLEEIDADGRAHYVTEGALRASYRALHPAPWGEDLDLPFHRSNKKDLADLGGEPVELVFDLLATALVFDKGHRIRVTVAGADAANYALYPDRRGRDAPTVSIHRDRAMASYLELPIGR